MEPVPSLEIATPAFIDLWVGAGDSWQRGWECIAQVSECGLVPFDPKKAKFIEVFQWPSLPADRVEVVDFLRYRGPAHRTVRSVYLDNIFNPIAPSAYMNWTPAPGDYGYVSPIVARHARSSEDGNRLFARQLILLGAEYVIARGSITEVQPDMNEYGWTLIFNSHGERWNGQPWPTTWGGMVRAWKDEGGGK